MPIRVLHVVTYMGRGGLETMLMNYYRCIDRTKVQFDFLTHRDFEADYDQEIEELGGIIYHLPKLNPFSYTYLKQLDLFFKRHKEYKIVHSHLDCMAGLPLKYAEINGVPVRIAHAHNTNQVKDLKYWLKIYFKRSIMKYATDLFACSKDAGRWMFGDKPFLVLHNVVDARQYTYSPECGMKMREVLEIEKDTLVVGHVGRFSIQKNHGFLLDIFAEIVKIQPDSVLLLIGTGELQKTIFQKVNKLELSDKVIFTGLRNDVSHLMQVMDVFVLPSLFEGFPLVMIEAQSAGLPCVISDKVPKECIKTNGLVEQMKLSDSPRQWANKIIENSGIERRDTYSEIADAGFDCRENAKELCDFYLSKGMQLDL